MTSSAFDMLLGVKAQYDSGGRRRQSGTLKNSFVHKIVHTKSPDATIHHGIVAACPNPSVKRHDGSFYYVAYVSIPIEWVSFVTEEFVSQYDITFIGPAGTIQRLPPSMRDFDTVFGERLYIGIDYMWMLTSPMFISPVDVYNRLPVIVSALREIADAQKQKAVE